MNYKFNEIRTIFRVSKDDFHTIGVKITLIICTFIIPETNCKFEESKTNLIMKNTVYISGFLALFLIQSCNKSTDGNKGVIVSEPSGKVENSLSVNNDTAQVTSKPIESDKSNLPEYTQRYVAEDGSSALVTFKKSDDGNTISIRSNNKTITIPQKDSDGTATVYENDGIVIKSEDNVITITQGNNVISLKKARGE